MSYALANAHPSIYDVHNLSLKLYEKTIVLSTTTTLITQKPLDHIDQTVIGQLLILERLRFSDLLKPTDRRKKDLNPLVAFYPSQLRYVYYLPQNDAMSYVIHRVA